jgi:hypothetical protein
LASDGLVPDPSSQLIMALGQYALPADTIHAGRCILEKKKREDINFQPNTESAVHQKRSVSNRWQRVGNDGRIK